MVFLADITGTPITKPEHFYLILTMHTKVDLQNVQCVHGYVLYRALVFSF